MLVSNAADAWSDVGLEAIPDTLNATETPKELSCTLPHVEGGESEEKERSIRLPSHEFPGVSN